jgi:WD40 repeat protein
VYQLQTIVNMLSLKLRLYYDSWNLKDKTKEAVLEGHNDSIRGIAITNDNAYIISGSDDKTLRL